MTARDVVFFEVLLRRHVFKNAKIQFIVFCEFFFGFMTSLL